MKPESTNLSTKRLQSKNTDSRSRGGRTGHTAGESHPRPLETSWAESVRSPAENKKESGAEGCGVGQVNTESLQTQRVNRDLGQTNELTQNRN